MRVMSECATLNAAKVGSAFIGSYLSELSNFHEMLVDQCIDREECSTVALI